MTSRNHSQLPRDTRFQFLSDLHLETGNEYDSFTIPVKAPYLILAGDIGRLSNYAQYLVFIARQCSVFERVFLVLGNHEFFGLTREEALQEATSLEQEPELKGKLTVLNRKRIDLGANNEVTLLGCTLWSHIPPADREVVQRKVGDFRRIQKWTIDSHNMEHQQDLEWLQHQLRLVNEEAPSTRRRILVVTHHAPSKKETSKPEHVDSPWSSAFATDLFADHAHSDLKKVDTWIFGHTHYTTQFSMGNVKFRSNQRGQTIAGSAGNRDAPRSWHQRLRDVFMQDKHAFRSDRVVSI